MPRTVRTVSRDIVVIGASAGGLPAVLEMVIHTSPDSPSVLPTQLRRATPLDVVVAEDGQEIRRGRISVARPDHHLLIKRAHPSRPSR